MIQSISDIPMLLYLKDSATRYTNVSIPLYSDIIKNLFSVVLIRYHIIYFWNILPKSFVTLNKNQDSSYTSEGWSIHIITLSLYRIVTTQIFKVLPIISRSCIKFVDNFKCMSRNVALLNRNFVVRDLRSITFEFTFWLVTDWM